MTLLAFVIGFLTATVILLHIGVIVMRNHIAEFECMRDPYDEEEE